MLVNLNLNTPRYKKQNTAFGNEHSANLIKGAIQTALNTNAPQIKITKEQALERVLEAIRREDKTGKSILRRFRQVLEELPDTQIPQGKNSSKTGK